MLRGGLRGIYYTPYFVDLSGFDIVPYFKTARHFPMIISVSSTLTASFSTAIG